MKPPSILVIDDEPDNFTVVEALLTDRSYELHYAANGEDAIDALDLFQPDVILLDVMMPGMDGMEVCQCIKAMPKWQSVPIIMVTALSSKEDLARCLKAGATDFISKPLSGLELTARVHAMLQIKQQYDDLKSLLQLREEMVSMVVHDLRNPLANILIGLDLLEMLDLSPEKQQLKISQIRHSGQMLQSLIDDLLLMAKMESGQLQLNRTEVDLCTLIPSVFSGLEAIAAQQHVVLVSNLPKFSGFMVVDAALFRRVLDNLLINAIKFSPRGSKVVLSIDYPTSSEIRIQVADWGSGVPDMFRQTIFEKYKIGTLMRGISQIGLGLAFCKMVVDAHRGTIQVKSNEPNGSIFELVLPLSLDIYQPSCNDLASFTETLPSLHLGS